MRIPLGVNLESRDGGVDKDARVVNGIVEVKGEGDLRVRKRPGFSDVGLVKAGTAQFLYAWNGINTIQADYLSRGTISTIVSGPTQTYLAVTVALNPSDKGANTTLSNNNLTATNGAAAGTWSAIRAAFSKSSGKWYWEVSGSGNTYIVGVGDSSASLTTWVGNDVHGWGVASNTGNAWHNGTSTALSTAFSAGEAVGFALDMDGGTLKLYRSGSLVGTVASSLTGDIFPMVAVNGGGIVTVNFGATAFANAVPSGFSAFQTTYTAGLSFSAADTGSNATTAYMMLKNRVQAWTLNRAGTLAAITYPDSMGANVYNLVSLTRSGTTATGTLSESPTFNVGDSVTIAGATPSDYNGAVTVTAVTPGSFTPGADIPITITRSGTTATATTVSGDAHGLTTSTAYTISGANETAYNGSKTITVTSPSKFTYSVTTSGGGSSSITGTWNPSDSTGVTLSNGNLTATTAASSNSFVGSRGTVGKSSGVWYWEVTVSAFYPGGWYAIGVAPTTLSLALTGLGSTSTSCSYTSDGQIEINGVRSGSGESLTTGDVIGVHLDMDAGSISFYNNGNFQFSATGLSGTLYPAIQFNENEHDSATANFGATSFAYDDLTPNATASGSIVVTKPAVTVNSTFTYTVAGSPTTPATGTITASTNGGTVPGIPYIDGYFCVMDINGVIWNSDSDDPTTWGALNFITAQAINGAGKALARSQNYLIALKEWSTEYFYDADNETGSPFSPAQNGFTQIGCASGDSVAQIEGNLLWISQVKERGRAVHMMTGLQIQPVSTPDIERILGNDDFATVYAYGLKINGHPLYILTLVTSGITMVYDLKSQIWSQWTSLTLGSSKSVSSISRSGTTATVTTSTAHGLSDGDPVKIAGADQSEYNTIFQARVTSTTVFTIEVDGAPTTPATGTITATPYTSSYFKFTKYCDYQGANLFLHESDGHLYQMSDTLYRDAGIPIERMVRTVRLDGGSTDIKKMSRVTIVGDRVADDGVNNLMMIRYSDDDGTTWSKYRIADLSLDQPMVRKMGAFRRRTIETKDTGNSAPVLQALEIEVGQ